MWTAKTAHFWKAYVAPCRPTRFELDLCSKAAANLRSRFNRRPRVLILGSTNEFRDWAYEEACEVTVMDNSLEFHKAISRDRRYKRGIETVICENWQNMQFSQQFELVLGDLVIGNVAPDKVETIVRKVRSALVQDGMFFTKSFFFLPDRVNRPLMQVLADYEKTNQLQDPFPLLAYDLSINAMDKKTHVLRFSRMYNLLESAHASGIVSNKTFDRYKALGWDSDGKLEFYLLPLNRWESLLRRHFSHYDVKYGPHSWSRDFPIYIAQR